MIRNKYWFGSKKIFQFIFDKKYHAGSHRESINHKFYYISVRFWHLIETYMYHWSAYIYRFSHLLQQRARQGTKGIDMRHVRAFLLGDVETIRESLDRLLEPIEEIVFFQRFEQHRRDDLTRLVVNQNYTVRGIFFDSLKPTQEIRQRGHFALGFDYLRKK